MSRYLYKKIQNISPESLNFQHSGLKLTTLPSDLLNMWHRGSFSSASASLNYHFGKHGSGVGTSNIVSYAQSAKNFKSNLSGAKSSKVNGSTPNVTRWKKNGKYIDICGSKNIGKIISYDRQ